MLQLIKTGMFCGVLNSAAGNSHPYYFQWGGKVPMEDKHLCYFRPTSPPLALLQKNYSWTHIFQGRHHLASESVWQVLYLRNIKSVVNLYLIDQTVTIQSIRVSRLPETRERNNSKEKQFQCVNRHRIALRVCCLYLTDGFSPKGRKTGRSLFTSGYKRSFEHAWCDSGLKGYLSWILKSSSSRFLILFTLKQHFSIRCSNQQNKIASGSSP